jgi:hypothetical protein
MFFSTELVLKTEKKKKKMKRKKMKCFFFFSGILHIISIIYQKKNK